MIYIRYMKNITFNAILSLITITIGVGLATCSPKAQESVRKTAPIHLTDPTDKDLNDIVKMYMDLSARNNITFTNKVSIGFANINRGNAIGVCTYGGMWREIDIDNEFWKYSSYASKISLVFHELNHCYCTRDHDFAKDKKYPSMSYNLFNFGEIDKDAYFDDECPTSLMHPTIVNDYCLQKHYGHYVKELFNRCEPY